MNNFQPIQKATFSSIALILTATAAILLPSNFVQGIICIALAIIAVVLREILKSS